MHDGVRWLIALAIALVLIGLIAYARGAERYRGDEVGTHGTKVIVRTDDG